MSDAHGYSSHAPASAAATAATAIHYEIVTPAGRVASGECDLLVAPAIQGEIGIMRNHTPFLSALSTGVLRVKHSGAEDRLFLSGGFLEVLENKVIVLAETAEKSDAIDVARAEKALERARKELEIGHGRVSATAAADRMTARRAQERARARLKAAKG